MRRILFKTFIFVSIVLLVTLIVNKYRDVNNPQTQTDISLPHGLLIDVSTLDDTIDKLGDPVAQEDISYYFKSTSISRMNEARFEDKVLIFFREIITEENKRSVKEINKIFGLPERVLYSDISSGGYNLYAYPSRGLAYIGKGSTNEVLEIWYFSPTNYDEFKESFANEYTEQRESLNVY